MNCNELYVHNCERLLGILLACFPVYFHKRKRKKEEFSEEEGKKKKRMKVQSNIDLIYRAKNGICQNSSPYFVFGLFNGFDLEQDRENHGVWAA